VVTAAVTDDERTVAVEAITCAIAGNTVRIDAGRRRSPREIAAIVGLVATELDAEVIVSARRDSVEVSHPRSAISRRRRHGLPPL
jgi:hypothetical protein